MTTARKGGKDAGEGAREKLSSPWSNRRGRRSEGGDEDTGIGPGEWRQGADDGADASVEPGPPRIDF